jgi:hypothetical protein
MATNDKTIALEMEPFVHGVERRMQEIDCDVERARRELLLGIGGERTEFCSFR